MTISGVAGQEMSCISVFQPCAISILKIFIFKEGSSCLSSIKYVCNLHEYQLLESANKTNETKLGCVL